MATSYVAGFESRHVQEITLLHNRPDRLWGSIQAPIKFVPGFSSWLGREVDHLPPSSARLRMDGSTLLLPYTSSWYGQG